eukprot:CAMPEP_0119472964 /NCGR_PEP_ID=MMETSP1344-20130328/4815_1 /TAXON_ID=236787 /ORGANISM="Florenciella parvula, Strain CCMP2471" /LENGTH=52 /DNA_ID=CAMNT_0007506009 /DNA_START=129 /DNA_END=284 /DNA_ORIENTATION=+
MNGTKLDLREDPNTVDRLKQKHQQPVASVARPPAARCAARASQFETPTTPPK